MRLLFVDDEPMSNKYISFYFSRFYSIQTAESVDDAMAIIDENKGDFDIVITDYFMPNKTGLNLLEIIKMKYPKIKRVLHTGYLDQKLSIYIDNKTIEYVFEKGISFPDLHKEIELIKE
jgi:two-component system response regulator PhcR